MRVGTQTGTALTLGMVAAFTQRGRLTASAVQQGVIDPPVGERARAIHQKFILL
jgi:hypothetical protein